MTHVYASGVGMNYLLNPSAAKLTYKILQYYLIMYCTCETHLRTPDGRPCLQNPSALWSTYSTCCMRDPRAPRGSTPHLQNPPGARPTYTFPALARPTYISTLSTLTPQGSVASSSELCIVAEMDSLSLRISARLRVPRTFLRVVAARRRVEWL